MIWIAIISVAVLIVAGLAYYAGKLLWQVQAQKEAQQQEREKKLTYITDSISHIAKAMAAQQCEFSEGVLRIWVLLDHYNQAHPESEQQDYRAKYPGFAKLYDVVKDMPTHDARKKFSKQEIFDMDKVRWQAEKDLKQQVETDIEGLLKDFA